MVGEWVNPYIAGAPVTEARTFFGREDVFDWIQNGLTGKYADHILVIHGLRRVGKSSVLKQHGPSLPRRHIPVFFALQGRDHTTLHRFLRWLAREIVNGLFWHVHRMCIYSSLGDRYVLERKGPCQT